MPIAATRVSRLLGLALLEREAAGPGLLIPRCRSVHTFGMRFALDLVFLDQAARPVSVRRTVPPRRIAAKRHARAVLEIPVAAEEGSVPEATLVVCEDDAPTLDLLCDHLHADRFKALPAPSAGDALRLCHYNDPDLLLLDLRLPDASGLDVLR